MKRLLLITMLAIISSASALAQSNAEREVLKLNKEYEEAIARRDFSVHERLFADDYNYTPGNGNFMGRAEHINFTKSGAVEVKSFRSEDVRVRAFGDTAIVTGLWISVDRRVGQEFTERRIRYILVYVRRSGRWQIVAEQRTGVAAQEKQDEPNPDHANVKYGAYERNMLDLWKAKSDKPTPLVIFIHGGGFRMGSKEQIAAHAELLLKCLEAGISVASINYRLTDVATYPAQMQDGARAVQYLRSRAKEFNLDPKRFAATGRSAGAGISLWLAFHDDLADEKAEDPVLRQSTRITSALGMQAQSSDDPRWIKKNIGGRAHEHWALQHLFGVKPEAVENDKAAKLYEDASPINHLTKDDAPVMVTYTGEDEPSDIPGAGIHSRKFGEILKAEMEKIGLSCELSVGKGFVVEDQVKFFVKHFKPKGVG